jgi:positive regulator of sigma E activity
MRERAVVKEIMADGRAVVTIVQDVQCGAHCPSCHGCGSAASPQTEASAVNAAGAGPGDTVILESSTGQMLVLPLMIVIGAVLIPLLLFHLGRWLGGPSAMSWMMAAVGTILSIGGLWLYYARVSAAPPIARVVRVEIEGRTGAEA